MSIVKKRGRLSTSIAMAVAMACTTAAYAQETTSSIRGNISASSGTVAGATVTIIHTPSGSTKTSVTGAGGTYSTSGLRPGGPYTITVKAAGFPDVTLSDVFLSVGEPLSLPITLGGGSAGSVEEITIVANQIMGDLSAGPSTTMNRVDIEGVASVNRDIRDIARRDPFASFNPITRGVSIAGQNNRTNRFAVDGVRFSDNFGLQQGGLPTTRGPVPLDAVEQMSVKIAPYDITEGDFQGGSINVVLRSGGNDFSGSTFYTFTDDSFTGDKTRGRPVNLNFESKTWGGFLSGPIIEDKLFFAVSYEELDETNPASFGLAGAPNVVPNLSQSQLDNVASIAKSVYNYDTLGIRSVLPETDQKFTVKLDWNINDSHRLSYTAIKQEGYLQSPGTGSNSPVSPSLNYTSYATNEPEEVSSQVLQLNSDWTNDFSTEARLNFRDYAKVPSSLGEGGFAEFQVCLDPVSAGAIFQCAQTGTPRLFMGTERFSQADVVKQDQYGAELVARYELGDHSLKAQVAYSGVEITNVFVNAALGVYYFDSIDAFQKKQASQLTWQYSITGDLKDVIASFDYDQYTYSLQDSWTLSDTVNLTYGVRADMYKMDDKPPLNNFFQARYGMPNNVNIDDNLVIQPRISMTWSPTDRLTIRAGTGLFNGGAPDVFLGNSFSVAGVFGNTLNQITRTPGGTGCANGTAATAPALPADVCAAALDNISGRGITKLAPLANFLSTNIGALSGAPVNAMSGDFELPSTWKANVTFDYVADLGALGDDWNLGLDIYRGWVNEAALYTDLRLTKAGVDPLGNPIYADTFTRGTNNDLLMSNTGQGSSAVYVARIGKEWESGFSASINYAYSDIRSLSDMGTALSGGTTASGTYGASPMIDANFPLYGRSSFEIRDNFKLSLDYSHAFFGDYMTRVSLFGEYRSGTPYSLTMNSPGARSLWGTTGSSNRYMLYVPDVSSSTADPAVRFANQATYEAFRNYVVGAGLAQGQTVDKNSLKSPDYFKVDVHLEQEIPAPFLPDARFKIFADLENLLNLIDENYGAFRYFDPLTNVVNVACGVTSGSNCSQFTYSNFQAPVLQTQNRIGLWSVRLGARFEF